MTTDGRTVGTYEQMTFDFPRRDIRPKKGEENGAQKNEAASHGRIN